ncbi:MATE family efflux transporter [Lacrimispora sp. NSJ-141]|uniref:Multidrug export protein MepA n=1 Tax=Lientehia hominis TaxID=2897778 RepID=A0AAP2RIK2_9FIRM|nr:MATE family efflux transporter [Lientehia hominis]MCD2491520.1 MATE family efflux transporter [Lientehia hominis]
MSSLLGEVKTSKAIVKLAVPATLALLAKAVYNIVDTAYIGMLGSDTALAAVGVTLPLLLIMVSVENIFAAGAAVLAGRQLGADDKDGAGTTVTSVVGISVLIGIVLCLGGIAFMEPLLRMFGASDAVLPQAKDYAFWMFIAALANLPAQSMNCAARAESSVKISSIAVITGAALNVVLDPVFMFEWGLGMGVKGASLATTVSQIVTFLILSWFYGSGRSVIKMRKRYFKPTFSLIKAVTVIGIPTAVIQICLAAATSLTNIAAKPMPDSDLIIAAYGVVQRLVLIGCYVVMGFMQGYQPVASYAFGAKNEERFHESVRFSLRASLVLTAAVAAIYILLSRPLIMLFNRNPAVVGYGAKLLISQVALYPAFGLCYMMTITFQTIGEARYGLLLSVIRQGLFYIPFIVMLPRFFGINGIYFAQPASDVLTALVCIGSVRRMKQMAGRNMADQMIIGK